jgi:hypothetical protein
MKRFRIDAAKSLMVALLALGGVAAHQTVQARDHDDCEAPVNQWQPRDAVRDMARQKGWRIDRVKIDDGCYEVRGLDAEGQRFKAKIDPVTLDIVRIKRGDRDHDRDHGRERFRERDERNERNERGSRRGGGAAPEAPAGPGAKPQVEIR